MTQEQFLQVLQIVIDNQIEGCSFKGISINGILHSQGPPDTQLLVADLS